jgi:hypothetical protein
MRALLKSLCLIILLRVVRGSLTDTSEVTEAHTEVRALRKENRAQSLSLRLAAKTSR